MGLNYRKTIYARRLRSLRRAGHLEHPNLFFKILYFDKLKLFNNFLFFVVLFVKKRPATHLTSAAAAQQQQQHTAVVAAVNMHIGLVWGLRARRPEPFRPQISTWVRRHGRRQG